ncbi:MAG: hypothetical protein HQL93_01195 [Magnetococcales bacterium]|nr:hypothetical protein [Magnetococcales bacterium]
MNLEKQIEEFLNLLSEANILFRSGVGFYLEEGMDGVRFQARMQLSLHHEREMDVLSRFIESQLRTQLIVPELRGDVLQLLEQFSRLQRILVRNLEEFHVEGPDFLEILHPNIGELCHMVSLAVETCVEAGRVYFYETEKVGEYLSKVAFYEKEADKLALALVKKIFSQDLSLDRKMHLRRFSEKVDEPANKAEEIAAWLAIVFMRKAPMNKQTINH